jgi:hypothetical protein
MWIKAKRLTNATAAYGLLGFVFERLLGFAHQASSLSPESKVRCKKKVVSRPPRKLLTLACYALGEGAP